MVIQFSGLWVGLGSAALIAANPAHPAEKTGVIALLAGASAGDGLGLVDGPRLAVDESNSGGGVAGYKFQHVMGDTQNMSLESVTSAVQRLTNDPDLNALSTGYADYSNFQIELMAEQAMPCLLYSSTDSTRAIIAPHPDPTIWSSNASYDAYKAAMIPVLHSLDKSGKLKLQNKKVALISTDNPYSKSIMNGLKKSFEEDGWTVTSADLLPTGQISEWRTFLVKVRLDNQAVVIKTDPKAGNAAKSMTRFIERPTNNSRTFGSSRLRRQAGPVFSAAACSRRIPRAALDEPIALRPGGISAWPTRHAGPRAGCHC
ncbi:MULTISPECIES: ABC transporter substrate-binding protein [unclassified Bradyrhizobium]|uniref:ABC transporter substrate-binding protein n=1 Tax=unclassified Bradyrhizobium TaxID=2631580 RepID=UPI002305B78E|nr:MULTISPECIES: ABC transporter substrate-binding protein [unclassified Bradyrhizobium]